MSWIGDLASLELRHFFVCMRAITNLLMNAISIFDALERFDLFWETYVKCVVGCRTSSLLELS